MENQEETLKRIEEQADKIEEIAKLYNIDNSKVKELFLNCPQIMICTPNAKYSWEICG